MTVQTSQLSNGLRVVTDKISNVETAALGVWIKAGSRLESEKNNGVAHFLEHMAFKGTTTRSATDIAQAIENVGGYVNAGTSRETTSYYIRVLKNDVPLGMEILSDILLNSTFKNDELERERGVILQELGMTLDTPDDLIFDYYQDSSFKDQSLGRTILGTSKNINSIQFNDLRSFMNENYVNKQMVFAASGNIDHDQIVKLAEKLFKNSKNNSVKKIEKNSYIGGEKIKQKDLEQLHLILGFEGIPILNENYYALSVLTSILGGGMSSRLFQTIREKLGLVYSIYAFKACYTDTGTVGIYAGTGEEEVKKLIPVLTEEIKKICENISDTELNRSKTQLKAGLMMGLESTTNRCEHLANQMLFYGRPVTSLEISERIDSVSSNQLYDLAKKVFQSKLTLSAIGPSKNLLSKEKINNLLK